MTKLPSYLATKGAIKQKERAEHSQMDIIDPKQEQNQAS